MEPERTLFGVLGPFVAWRQTRSGRAEIDLGPPRQRAVLAALVLRPGRVIDVGDLVTAVWGSKAPRGGANVVQTYISSLRRALEPDRAPRSRGGLLVSTKEGYRLDIERSSIDAGLAEERLQQARGQGDVEQLRKVLELWRGTPLAGLPGPFANAQRTRFTELHAAVLEEFYAACLAEGSAGNEIVGELAALVEQHPLRERLRALLMRALDRDGRRADALAVFRQGRRLLVERQGVEPGHELQRLHHDILAADTVPSIPRQLPAPVYAFTGRDEEFAELDHLLDAGPTLPIAAVVGPAGVGKTSLVVQWAHRNLERFPDGQLFVDLRGFGSDATRSPQSVLSSLTTALGVPPARIPTEPDDARTLLRTMLAGRRMLLVLDNARTPEHVRLLLPGSPTATVIVTSRDEMAGLQAQEGARRIRLTPLRSEESDQLLRTLLGRAEQELAELCGHLPLALRIAAANLAPLESEAVEGYLQRLRTPHRLDALRVAGDEALATGPAFEASYDALPADAAAVFGLLGISPGKESGLKAIASLLGTETTEAGRALRILVGRHLVDERTDGRYALHDLLRDYANRLHDPAEGQAALRRCLDYYLHSVGSALSFVNPGWIELPEPEQRIVPERFDSGASALAWFDVECANLVEAVSTAYAAGLDSQAWQLARAPVTLFQMRGRWHDWIRTHEVALESARRLRDRQVESMTISSMAYAYLELGRPEQALRWYERAAASARGDRRTEAAVSEGMARAYRDLDDSAAAMKVAHRALALYRELGNRQGAGNALTQIALEYRDRGELDRSLECWELCLRFRRRDGYTLGEGSTLAEFGETCRRAGRLDEAQAYLSQSVCLLREIGHLQNLAGALRDLGKVRWELDEPDAARAAWEEALRIYEDAENSAAGVVRALLENAGSG